jgi:hypothetical protein
MPESPVKFPSGCGASWLHYHYLLTGVVELPNYNIALFSHGRSLVTAGSPAFPGKLTVGIIDMPELLVKFPSGCGASWCTITIFSPEWWNCQITILQFSGTDEAW